MMGGVSAAETFEEHRKHLFAVAYRMLGSSAEAEDIVQDAWLRFQEADMAAISSARAWLSTVVTRLCLDELKSARARREEYVGTWLPEPVRTEGGEPLADAESISLAFLVLLESLTPAERAVYLLHEVFDYSHAEVAAIVGKEEAACRQLFHRARARVVERRPRFAPSREQHSQILGSFLQAVTAGDISGLQSLLAEGVVTYPDGGGKVRAAKKPVLGGAAVARFLVGIARKGHMDPKAVEVAIVNGWPALVLREGGRATLVVGIETDGEKIHAVHIVVNPDKLARV
jgi:RNA polymerase sigma-70 factor (ECF subfamily)